MDQITHRICYQAVVPIAGVSQSELLARACEWATAAAVLNTQPVVTHTPDTEVLVMSGVQPFAYTYAITGTFNGLPRNRTTHLMLLYTMRIWLREGRYRYEATDFIFAYPADLPYARAQEPAENELIKTKALTVDRAKNITALRTRFQEATTMLLNQLQNVMCRKVSK